MFQQKSDTSIKDWGIFHETDGIFVFNLPAAEAQSCGKKVVAFNIGSHPEIVKNGILVDKSNMAKFAEEVVRTLKK